MSYSHSVQGAAFWAAFFAVAALLRGADAPPRILPPAGISIQTEDRDALAKRVEELTARLEARRDFALTPDLEVLVKAVDWALRHGEFYQEGDVQRARELLDLADKRLAEIRAGNPSWPRQRGRVVRGYRSRIDDSVQPYGLVIPPDLNLDRPVPLYVWLHGRGDKQTDLHFIHERLGRDGQITPPGAIVLHPFGRHCLGFKSAGEIDVLDAIDQVQQQYPIDPDRIVLMGFSMGGAGTWHIGAHYTDRFVSLSPGAGFAETARYTNLAADQFPPLYEQKLWGTYDVPCYVRNLFNRPVVVYSGELDKQIQAARVMEEAFRDEGRTLPHIIGPGMGHKYHPDSLAEILRRVGEDVSRGRPKLAPRVALQTRTLRYARQDWVTALRLDEHWQDARIDAEIAAERKLVVATKNVRALRLSPWPSMSGAVIAIDGESLTVPSANAVAYVDLIRETNWQILPPQASQLADGLAKRPGLQGPVDDAFLEPFLVVLPTATASHEKIEAWVQSELAHFQLRWELVFRGQVRVKRDVDVTPEDIEQFHLVVWGTPDSNSILQKAFALPGETLPVNWTKERVKVGDYDVAADSHVPVFVYPNPLHSERSKYLVVNSGPTFREGHDRTNSLQNPKLPDWALIDVRQAPTATAPGGIAAADFFDEGWNVR